MTCVKGHFHQIQKLLFGVNQNVKVSGLCVKCKKTQTKLHTELWVCRLQVIQVFSIYVLSVFLSHDSFPLYIGCKSPVFPMYFITINIVCSHFLNQKMCTGSYSFFFSLSDYMHIWHYMFLHLFLTIMR